MPATAETLCPPLTGPTAGAADSPAAGEGEIRRICSEALLGGGNMLEIEHAGQRYFLRLTRENKLILTK